MTVEIAIYRSGDPLSSDVAHGVANRIGAAKGLPTAVGELSLCPVRKDLNPVTVLMAPHWIVGTEAFDLHMRGVGFRVDEEVNLALLSGLREEVRVQSSANAPLLQVEAQTADEFLLCGILDLLAEEQPDLCVVHLVLRSTQRLRKMLQVKTALSNCNPAYPIAELIS